MTQQRIEELEAYIRMMELDFEVKVEREVEKRLPEAVAEHERQVQILKSSEFLESLRSLPTLTDKVKPSDWKKPFNNPIKMEILKDRKSESSAFPMMVWDLEVRHPDTFMGIDLATV